MDLPWVSLVWNTYYDGRVLEGTASCGSFWWKDIFCSDRWKLGDSVTTLQSRFPRLFSYVKDPWISVAEAFQAHDILDMFHLPLSE